MRRALGRTAGRMLGVVFVVVGVTMLTWLAMRVLRPSWFEGDDRSVPVQLGDYLGRGFLHFDFGRTFSPPQGTVASVIRAGLPADVSLIAGATAFGFIAGTAAGTYCAARRHSALARAFEGGAAFFIFAPLYVVGLMLITLFGSDIALVEIGVHIPRAYVEFDDGPVRWFGALVVPWILVGLPLAALLLRVTRTAVGNVLGEDYIQAAAAKGLTERTVLRRHALRAAAAPMITATGMTVNLMITNVVLIETVFGIPGVFGHLRDAIDHGDFPMLMGITVVGALLIALGNMFADLALAWLDPRTR